MSTIANKIREERLKANMTEKQLAKKCGLSANYIKDIESNKKIANEGLAEKILSVFGKESALDTFYNESEKEAPVVKVIIKEAPKEVFYNVQPNAQWGDALANIIKKFPIYDMKNNKVVASKELPILNKKIDGLAWEKLLFLKVSEVDFENFRIEQDDIIWVQLLNDIPSNGMYVIELNGKKIIRKIKKMGKNIELFKGIKGEIGLSVELKKVKIIGKCVKVEFDI
ncbi:MAG: helix-turn-helix transcriptional regulator [Acidaminobacteraceae bacterium]